MSRVEHLTEQQMMERSLDLLEGRMEEGQVERFLVDLHRKVKQQMNWSAWSRPCAKKQ